MVEVPASPLMKAQTDDEVSRATTVTTHPVYVSVATVTATTSDDSATPPDEASIRTAVSQLHDYWWEESGGTVDVRLAGIERTSLAKSTCDPSAVLDSVHTTAFGGAFASYRWAGTDDHLLVLTRETCGSAAFGTVGGSEPAFALPAGAVSDPIATDTATAIVKVLDKVEVTADEWNNNKDRFREEVLSDRRNRFFSAYMSKAKQKMKIEVNREALQRAVG